MSSTLVRVTANIPSPWVTLRPNDHCLFITNHPTVCFRWSVSRVSNGNQLKQSRVSNSPHSRIDDGEVADVGDLDERSTDSSGKGKENGGRTTKGFSSKELLQGLKRYGVAGVLSYGLLNTIYYLTTFLFVWFYFAPAPRGMGFVAAVERFLKVMAMVWAGSQVTKLLRAGGALALAPFVDKGLSWFTIKFKFNSKGKAFAAIAGMCFGLAFLFFGFTVLLASN